jgi:polyphenol oxidase
MVVSLKSPLLEAIPTVTHAFTTRQGGVSPGVFSSLNVALEKGDSLENGLENYRRIAHHVGGTLDQLVTLKQLHSNKVVVADAPWSLENRPEGDALVTRTKGLIIGIITADCAPVLIADPVLGIVAAIHAGWKGATAQIIQNTVKTLEQMGSIPKNLVAAIGPCIWQDSYEVDQNFYDNLPDPDDKIFFKPSVTPTHWLFDLPGYVEHQLKLSGIPSISSSPADTYSDEARFFSNRRRFHRHEEHFGCSLSCIKL